MMKRFRVFVAVLLAFGGVCLAGAGLTQGRPAYHGSAGPNAKDANVEKLAAAAARLEAQVKARPKDAKLKLQAADAEYKAGYASMMSPTLDRKVKYRDALRAFRRALALNPGHKQAAEQKAMIEAIYRQMGRPIPK